MQQQHQHRQARLVTGGVAAMALIALVALLAALTLAGVGSSVYAAPRDGGPTLAISNISGSAITLAGDGWVAGESVTLSYSASSLCDSATTLPISTNPFSLESSNFQETITWPSSIGQGAYYICASGSVSGGPYATQQTVIVNNSGSVQPTPGGTTPPATTATRGAPTSTHTPGGHPGSTATKSAATGSGDGGNSGPGNQGTSASTSVSSLVAIILLCLLVLALLIYLIRIWLQGRQVGGQNP